MNAETIAHGLGLKRAGRGWRGPCPIHGGSSFTVSEKSGKPVFYCWSGCERGAILAALKSAGLWPESDWTPMQKRDYAMQRARDEADMRAAGLFGMTAAIMAEQALDELPTTDPGRAVYTEMLRALGSEAGLLAEYRGWRAREPEFTAALVDAGRKHQERLEMLMSNYLVREINHAA